MTICKCGNEARTNQRYCWRCHAKHMREWRSSNPLSPKERIKSNARRYINMYIKRGKVKRGKCEVCQSPSVQPHHEDYSKPLQARWFCRRHHLTHHHKVQRKSTIEKYATSTNVSTTIKSRRPGTRSRRSITTISAISAITKE